MYCHEGSSNVELTDVRSTAAQQFKTLFHKGALVVPPASIGLSALFGYLAYRGKLLFEVASSPD
jgi:hypothetical protein